MNATKPGVKTSEFWLTAFAQLLPFLVILGIVPQADAQSITASVSSVVSGVFALTSLITYVLQRYALKSQSIDPAPVLPK
jgi:hypothetical protein